MSDTPSNAPEYYADMERERHERWLATQGERPVSSMADERDHHHDPRGEFGDHRTSEEARRSVSLYRS